MAGEVKTRKMNGYNFMYTSEGAINMNEVSGYYVVEDKVVVFFGIREVELNGEEARLFLKFAGDNRYRPQE